MHDAKWYQFWWPQSGFWGGVIVCAFLLLVLPRWAASDEMRTERDFQDAWCTGKTEYVLADRSRVDCLTDHYAIEIDFAVSSKWAESIGQALYYSTWFDDKQPGIMLIVRDQKDCKHVNKVRRSIRESKIAIQLWTFPQPCPL